MTSKIKHKINTIWQGIFDMTKNLVVLIDLAPTIKDYCNKKCVW